MAKRETIVLHHSASPRVSTTPEMIAEWHRARGFNSIGYHWIIDRLGKRVAGRPASKVGAHCKGFNSQSYGVCVVGNFENEEPTQKQIDELVSLLRDIRQYYGVIHLIGHKDAPHAATACPGRNLYALLPEIRKMTGLVK
ncbi:peptidoglycan recognition family protein [Sulfuricurvum sp.]|uniref:peptidoglycan recognition protein family protein n=1 Tax=Sulfuricurvum sp. TaxID=2025608 RepID=UPI0035661512